MYLDGEDTAGREIDSIYPMIPMYSIDMHAVPGRQKGVPLAVQDALVQEVSGWAGVDK